MPTTNISLKENNIGSCPILGPLLSCRCNKNLTVDWTLERVRGLFRVGCALAGAHWSPFGKGGSFWPEHGPFALQGTTGASAPPLRLDDPE